MARYRDLEQKIESLEQELKEVNRKVFFLTPQVDDAHKILDELDAPKSESGAFVGHRWFWFTEGKRESHKTRENTEGYHPEEWKRRMKRLEEIQTAPPPPKLPIVE